MQYVRTSALWVTGGQPLTTRSSATQNKREHRSNDTIVPQLIALSTKVLLIAPLEDVFGLASYVDPTFRYVAEQGPSARNINRHIENVRLWRESNPSFSAEVEDYCVALADDDTAAVVWITLSTRNITRENFRSIRGEVVATLQWRRKLDGPWLCTYLRTMRGPGLDFG
jgi:hypothetical protein